MDNKKIVKNFIVENFLFGEDDGFDGADSFREKGIIDSTGILELITFLEEKFEIRIEDDEIIPENLDSLAGIDEFLIAKKSGKESKKLAITY